MDDDSNRADEPVAPNGPPTLPPSLPPPLPQASDDGFADVDYYELDSRRATLREYLFETKNPIILAIAIAMKTLRVRLPGGSTDDPTVGRLLPFESTMDRLPEPARQPALDRLREVEALGFIEPIVHVIATPLQNTQHGMITLRHPDGRSIARVHVRISHHKVPPKVKPFVEFLTQLVDGRFVWSENGVSDTLEPPSCLWLREKNVGVAELHALHERRVADVGVAVAPVRDADGVRAVVDAHQADVVAFHVKRKFFAPAAREAVTLASQAASAGGAGASDGPVLVEIDRQLNKGGSWQSAIVLFVVTLFAFVALGASHWGGRFVGMLVPILFVHELGHYLAMRGFGYRNVRMFFLPMLGAAVSGRSFNVAAWKQAIVTLAGPLPGIVLAIPLGIVGLITHRPWMNEAALLALVINGFNLLPILPLDGGRVAQLLLFRRAPMLDVAFRVVACAAVIAGAIFSGDRYLGFFAVGLGLSVPLAVRVARATRVLRKRLVVPVVVPDGARSLPPAVAGEIVAELRRGCASADRDEDPRDAGARRLRRAERARAALAGGDRAGRRPRRRDRADGGRGDRVRRREQSVAPARDVAPRDAAAAAGSQ